jgi:hypothetical protein
MTELTRDVCVKVGMRWSLLFAALGVLAAVLLLVLLKIQALLTDAGSEFLTAMIVGLVTLCVFAVLLGRLAGRIIYRGGNNVLVNLVAGVLLAFACMIISANAGTLAGVLLVVSKQPAFVRSNVLKDAGSLSLLILFYGFAPAVLLGLLYGVLVKVTLDRRSKIA